MRILSYGKKKYNSTERNKKKQININKLIKYFNKISSNVSFSYFSLFKKVESERCTSLLKKPKRSKYYYFAFNIDEFIKKFYNNSYSLLDIMFLFVALHKSQVISVFNFLISNHKYYGQNSVTMYKINNRKYNHISKDDNVIKSRQLFVLGVISLLKDYFAVCDKSKEEKDNNEQLITNLFEGIFSNDYNLINDFKNINTAICGSYSQTGEIMNTILKTYADEIDQINEVKVRILNYYKKFLSDELHFVNLCGNELARMDINVDIDELSEIDMDVNNMKEQNQFYQNLSSAFREANKMDYQVITFSEEQNQFCQNLSSAFREANKMDYQVICQDLDSAFEEFDETNHQGATLFSKK